jgi:hypothetical protein
MHLSCSKFQRLPEFFHKVNACHCLRSHIYLLFEITDFTDQIFQGRVSIFTSQELLCYVISDVELMTTLNQILFSVIFVGKRKRNSKCVIILGERGGVMFKFFLFLTNS